MRESLRVRLVLWYALVLALVIVLFGGAVVYQSWRTMMGGVDAELDAYAREVTKTLRPVEGGRFDLELPADAATYFFRREGGRPYYVIWGPNGELVDQSDPDLQVTRPGNTVEGRREKSFPAAGGATVLVGRDITDLRRAQWGLFLNVALAALATLAVAIFGGWFVAGRALAPIKRISQTARAMSEGDLNARIAVEHTESELGQVASTLNDAFDRLRLAVEQQRRFIADASHELRTPISVLRAETEWALDRERSVQQYKEALTVGRRAGLRMQDIVERLLALVRADVTPEVHEPAPVAMRRLIDDVVTWLAPIAQTSGVRLNVAGDSFTVNGDAEQLREALNNVIANAILYNKPGGSVTISMREAAGAARIEVADTGIGIPADAVPRVFDRFFRVDKARSREMGGSGLGLSIARTIFVAHGGDITCTSEPGVGSMFVISLPALTRDASVCSPTSP
ncbi:MAG TPA: HAMP domain-containing sensor histidine kinase [Vicinamibacterales bacterium]|nr:HAMP domain-containing sensor histidine kinase [Vicinamibacterales bacterium]